MTVNPAIRAGDPVSDPSLIFETPPSHKHRIEAILHAQALRLGRQRRRILTVGLPPMWFLVCLSKVSV